MFVIESTTVYSLWGFILMTECDWDVKYCNVWNNSSVQMYHKIKGFLFDKAGLLSSSK